MHPFIQGKIGSLYTGTTNQVELSKSIINKLIFPTPPLLEQNEIIYRLEFLLGQVDKIKNRIDGIPAILKRFRQSVLSAAVSGKLTEDWRGKHININTNPADTWPSVDKKDGPFDIPNSWIGCNLGSVSKRVSVGHVGKTTEYYTNENNGIPFLRSQNVRQGFISTNNLAFITKDFHRKLKKSQLDAGDLLIVRVGANRGDACILPQTFQGCNCANIVLAKPLKGLSDYLNIYYQSPIVRDILLGKTVGGAQGVINTKTIEDSFLALPSFEEQKEIVKRVETYFALADSIKSKVDEAQKRIDNLTQSILAKAFSGALTKEWRELNRELINGENSAFSLLEKIKEEKKNLQPIKKKWYKGVNKVKMKKIIPITSALKNAGKPLTSQELLREAGYPNDSSTEIIEKFFLDIRESLENGSINKTRIGSEDVFELLGIEIQT